MHTHRWLIGLASTLALLGGAILACSAGSAPQTQKPKITCNSSPNFSSCTCGLNGSGLALCSRDFLGAGSRCCARAGWSTEPTSSCICRALPKCYSLAGSCTCGLYEDPSTDNLLFLEKGSCAPPASGHCCDDGVGTCTCSANACSASATEVPQCAPKAAPCLDTETEVFSCTE